MERSFTESRDKILVMWKKSSWNHAMESREMGAWNWPLDENNIVEINGDDEITGKVNSDDDNIGKVNRDEKNIIEVNGEDKNIVEVNSDDKNIGEVNKQRDNFVNQTCEADYFKGERRDNFVINTRDDIKKQSSKQQ